jgi:hypothetical protein
MEMVKNSIVVGLSMDAGQRVKLRNEQARDGDPNRACKASKQNQERFIWQLVGVLDT